MATLAESLEKIYNVKVDIKDALTEVGADMTNAKFDEYADVIRTLSLKKELFDNGVTTRLKNYMKWSDDDAKTLKEEFWWKTGNNSAYYLSADEIDQMRLNDYDEVTVAECRDIWDIFRIRFAPKIVNENSNFTNAFRNLNTVEAFGEISDIITDLTSGFENCSALKYLPKMNTESCTSFNSALKSCYCLRHAAVGMSSAVTASSMFENCYSLVSANLTTRNTLTTVDRMFYNCYSLTSVEELDFTNVSSCTDMFVNCSLLTDCKIKNLNCNISFVYTTHLSKTDLLYIISNAGNSNITITLNPLLIEIWENDSDLQTALANKPNITLV